ncbi:MAG: PAS domain-containing protein [Rhizobiales bacterium]|nr:PAS domain-containing protein [Hyphomicrobiales bacterium]
MNNPLLDTTEDQGPSPVMPSLPAEFSVDHVTDLLCGAEAGLALFDRDLKLVFANGQYLQLCGYSRHEVEPGVKLADLARLSLERVGSDIGSIDSTVDRGIERLIAVGGYSFRFVAPSGKNIYVHRRRLESGQVVETVRELAEGSGEVAGDDRLEMLAHAARTRMSHALEAMADGFALYDADDRLVAYNKQYIDLNQHIADIIAPGLTYEEMLRIGMERSGYETNGMDHESFINWRLEQHRNPGEPHDLLMNDGRWVRVHERLTSDGGIVGIRSDITELKHREAEILRVSNELRRSNMHFDTALNNMIQGLCMFDANQTLLVCNKIYLEMYGFSPDVVKPGIKLPEIMDYSVSIGNYTREDADRAKAARPDTAKLRTVATIKQHLRDGRIIAVMHQPMQDGGSIATYQDITEIEKSQNALRLHARKLEESNRELEEFAYVASHDLQEPLRKIETFGDRLQTKYAEELPDGGKEYVSRMQNATGRMRQLINDLLAYSRVTTKAKPFELIDLNRHIDGVCSDLQMRIEETKADVVYEDLPSITADPTQLRQLLQNLIGNALKFQRPNVKPIVTITAEILHGDASIGQRDRCQIVIADNGIGFDNKYKAQIFTIFQRLHGRNEYEGTGIGLATCRKIVERHDGIIDAEGVEGQGAKFIITLPVHEPDSNMEGKPDAA